MGGGVLGLRGNKSACPTNKWNVTHGSPVCSYWEGVGLRLLPHLCWRSPNHPKQDSPQGRSLWRAAPLTRTGSLRLGNHLVWPFPGRPYWNGKPSLPPKKGQSRGRNPLQHSFPGTSGTQAPPHHDKAAPTWGGFTMK